MVFQMCQMDFRSSVPKTKTKNKKSRLSSMTHLLESHHQRLDGFR